jgi:hypothetical protein
MKTIQEVQSKESRLRELSEVLGCGIPDIPKSIRNLRIGNGELAEEISRVSRLLSTPGLGVTVYVGRTAQ